MSRYFIKHYSKQHMDGFTLIELLVVMVIVFFCVLIAAGPMHDRTNHARIEQTMTAMAEIKDAILGRPLPGEPALYDVGYVPDMGELPDLIDGQPRGLWTTDANNNGSDDILRRCLFLDNGHTTEGDGGGVLYSPLYLYMGWRGPYISAPRDGVFRDGWGNKLIFNKDTPDQGDMTIVSPGANGIISEKDTGAESDIKLVIRKTGFMAPVSGVIIPSGLYKDNFNSNSVTDVMIRIYYTAPGPSEAHEKITDLVFIEPEKQDLDAVITEDGYFMFPEVPVGPDRLLEISQPMPAEPGKKAVTYISFEVMPTLNWLGRIDIRNSYDLY
ncbi:MAG: prepilin-type N-terminal cleavage/methylation domain-containing protein [Desulfobacteraceae bacterium]|jgi:prepilin-type N-terminal cleavage/methylation domain-containing protein